MFYQRLAYFLSAKALQFCIPLESMLVAIVVNSSCPFGIGWTKVEAIDSLMRKAGFSGPITESLRKRIRLTRYQSTLFALHYSDYASYVKTTRGAAPSILGAKPGNY